MVDYTPASATTIASYQLLSSGTAFDTSPVVYASQLQQISLALASISQSIPTIDGTVVAELKSAATQHAALADHLNDHYANLVDNLGLVTSAISDSIGYGVIGTAGHPAGSLTDPLASMPDYFGSIMGQSNLIVAQSTNLMVGIAAHSAGMLAGGVITSLITSTGVSADLTAILSNYTPSNTTLLPLLSSMSAANLTQLAASISAIGRLPKISALGSVSTSLGSLENVAQLGVGLQNLSILVGLGNLASEANLAQLGTNLSTLSSAVIGMLNSLTGQVGSDLTTLTTKLNTMIGSAA